jgi:hypothetical protein
MKISITRGGVLAKHNPNNQKAESKGSHILRIGVSYKKYVTKGIPRPNKIIYFSSLRNVFVVGRD